MKSSNRWLTRMLSFAAALACLSACNLQLATLAPGTAQYIVVTATPQSGGDETQAQPPANTEFAPSLTATLTPTLTATPTITPTATPVLPTMTAGQNLSCVKGPHWILYEWVAGIAEGEVVTLLARSPAEWPDYYYVRKSNGIECWAFSGSSTVTGDVSTLPVKEAPPLPEVEYTIKNATGLNVLAIRIREKDSSVWGANLLAASLTPGSTFSKTLTAGFYDVIVHDPVGGILYQKEDYPIGSDANYRNIVLDDELEFYFQNNFAFDLCIFNVKPNGGSWKAIHAAADGHVTPGNRITFNLLPAMYSVRVWRCTGPLVVDAVNVYFGPLVPGYNLP